MGMLSWRRARAQWRGVFRIAESTIAAAASAAAGSIRSRSCKIGSMRVMQSDAPGHDRINENWRNRSDPLRCSP